MNFNLYPYRITFLNPFLIGLTFLSLNIFINLYSGTFLIFFVFIIGWFILGILIYKVTFLAHDCAHSSLWKGKEMNLLAGYFSSFFLIIPFHVYKKTHLSHHAAKRIEDDPDINNYWPKFLRSNSNPIIKYSDTHKLKLWLLSPLLLKRSINIFKNLIFYSNSKKIKNQKLVSDYLKKLIIPLINILFLTIYISFTALIANKLFNVGLIRFQIVYILFIYFLSALTLSLMLGRWRTFAEHVEINFDNKKRELSLFYKNRGINTKRSFLSNLVMHDANFNIHEMHHRFPNISSLKLVQSRQINNFQHNSKEYLYIEEPNTLTKITKIFLI